MRPPRSGLRPLLRVHGCGGHRKQRRAVSEVFEEVVQEIETQPAIFLAEIFAVVVLSALFEKAEHWVRTELVNGDKTGRQIINALFKEVTVLGFIGLLLFLLTRSGTADSVAAAILGSRDWESESENPLAETFETVHIMIFMLLVVLLLQALAVLVVTRQVSDTWACFERMRAFGSQESSIESQLVKAGYLKRTHNPSEPRETELICAKPFVYGATVMERLQLREDTLHMVVMFRALRHEFLYPRKETRRTTARVRDPALFSFERYLSERLGETVLALVEIDIKTWVKALALMVPIIYWVLQQNEVVVRAAQCGLAWVLVIVGAVLALLLAEDIYEFTPEVPQDSRLTLRIFAGTSSQMLKRSSQAAARWAARRQGAEDEAESSDEPGHQLQTVAHGLRRAPLRSPYSIDLALAGLGDAANVVNPKLGLPPYYKVESGPNGPGSHTTYLSAALYQDYLRFLSFLQAINVTSLIVAAFSTDFVEPLQIFFYLLTWAQWPVYLFVVVPGILRCLTVRNSIEKKKCPAAIQLVSQEGTDSLLRDCLVLVRLAGLGHRAQEPLHHSPGRSEMVKSAHEEFKNSLSRSIQYEIWTMFAVWDAQNTGQVDVCEVAKTFQGMGFTEHAAHERASGLVKFVDEDGSGVLTLRKLQAATVLATLHGQPHEEEEDLLTFFELLDENGDCQVSIAELARGLKRMRIGIREEDVANLLYRYFGRAKLKVSKDDFVAWAKHMGSLQAAEAAA